MLRNLFITTGIVLLFGCICYSLFGNSGNRLHVSVPINIGYFLVIATCFICATIYRSEEKNQRIRFLIYQVVSEKQLSLPDLTDKVKTIYLSSQGNDSSALRRELVMMIEEGKLELKDGLVVLV